MRSPVSLRRRDVRARALEVPLQLLRDRVQLAHARLRARALPLRARRLRARRVGELAPVVAQIFEDVLHRVENRARVGRRRVREHRRHALEDGEVQIALDGEEDGGAAGVVVHARDLRARVRYDVLMDGRRARGGRVIAVGTTAVRSLESVALKVPEGDPLVPYAGDTDIFLYPGAQFRVVDAMITNFHLPESTLLMLVSAFAGVESIRAAYAAAIANRYRFFSYGDAMFLSKKESH